MTAPEHTALTPMSALKNTESQFCIDSSDGEEGTGNQVALVQITDTSLLTLRGIREPHAARKRRQRQMTPNDLKDSAYWDKRRKNNEAARRSRERRRMSDTLLEGQLLALSKENAQLRAHLLTLQCYLGVGQQTAVSQLAPLGLRPSTQVSTQCLQRIPCFPSQLLLEPSVKPPQNYSAYFSKPLPAAPDATCQPSAPLPPLLGLDTPTLCSSSMFVPWFSPNLHPMHQSVPLCLALQGPDVHHNSLDNPHNIQSNMDTLSAELAHLKRYFI